MTEENQKHHWLRIGAIALMTFIIAFLAFYLVMEIMFNRITDPMYRVKKIERIMENDVRKMQKYNDNTMENPFEPRMRPMIVNLVKENNEYKVIVDLKPLDGNENNINIDYTDKFLTIKGELDKQNHGNEKIVNFTQSYYIEDELDMEKMVKEKKGNKYIITIPFED